MAETGVLMNPPPLELATAVNDSIQRFIASTLAPEDHGGVIAVTTTKGVNLAVIQRTGDHGEIVAYVGKTWGDPVEGGVQWRIKW